MMMISMTITTTATLKWLMIESLELGYMKHEEMLAADKPSRPGVVISFVRATIR